MQMTAYEDVLRWAESRPWWQQKALARIAAGEVIGEQEYEEIARSLLKQPELPPNGGWFTQIKPPQATKDEPVRILAVRGLKNVNRLASDQELTFEPDGLTVVFGNNGSGKSGYARVIRSMVRARHRSALLPDVFAQKPGSQSGQVVFRVGTTEHTAPLGESPAPDLSRVAFYDEHCGDAYLTAEAEISYRPSAVQLLEDLATVCAGVYRVIDAWKQEESHSGPLPAVDDGGPGGIFLRSLEASTTDDAMSVAIACPSDVDEQLDKQVKKVARLRITDPTQEKRRLSDVANACTTIADHLETVGQAIGVDAQERLDELVKNAVTAQEAADLASRKTFANEPLSEVGSDTWKKLWRAAEQYSKATYPGHDFPHTTDSAVCVLCQQTLGPDAVNRLERFQQFVMDTTAQEAEDARRQVTEFQQHLSELYITTPALSSAIATLDLSEKITTGPLHSLLEAMQTRKSALVEGEESKPVDVSTLVADLRKDAVLARKAADNVDTIGFADRLTEAKLEEQRLRDQIAMRDGRSLIEKERARLQKVAMLDKKLAEANTRAITMKASELTRTYVTQEACAHFTRETGGLDLQHVTFTATKGRQGTLLHKADFLNARPGSKLVDVLSEGEQTVLGFAGFLTEVHFDASKSALIFDDPVSSLDHVKRESVARRIVALAKERQVVVFTHDVAFTMFLHKAASESEVRFCTRGIEQRRNMGPGYTTRHHPWTAKDAAQRIDMLWQEVAALRRDETGMSEGDYLRRTEQIAGHMSQAWERVISQVLAEPLLDYKSLEVRVGKLRIVGRVTERDVKTYDDSYSRISGWASRHDPHPEVNYTPPTTEQLKDEIQVIADWMKTVKRYQSS